MQTKTATIGDTLKFAAQRERIDIHTALPARVVSFDPVKNTVEVEPMIKQVLSDGSFSELPVLVDVPVQFPRGGGFAITFPISAGDEGLVVFNERCIDGWWATGDKSEPLDYRLHDYSDAVFIAGISSVPNAVPDIYMSGVSMRTLDDSTYIRLTQGKIYIKGDIEHEGSTEQSGSYGMTGNLHTGGNNSTDGNVTVQGNTTTVGNTSTNGLSAGAGGGSSTFNGTINHIGKYNLIGDFVAQGKVSSNGVVLDEHTHGGVDTGESDTKEPNK